MTTDEQSDLIRELSRLLCGLQVPISMFMELGTAREAFCEVRRMIRAFGWMNDKETEDLLTKALTIESRPPTMCTINPFEAIERAQTTIMPIRVKSP